MQPEPGNRALGDKRLCLSSENVLEVVVVVMVVVGEGTQVDPDGVISLT